MNAPPFAPPSPTDPSEAAQAVLAEVTCAWDAHQATVDGETSGGAAGQVQALLVHTGSDMLVLEAADPRAELPALGTLMRISGAKGPTTGRLAERGRNGRFLLSLSDRPVRRALRLRVSLPGTLKTSRLSPPQGVQIADLATGGARVRGIELAVGEAVTLEFTPPGREETVTVRAVVAHSTQSARQPWVGVSFRLVAMRGGR